MSIRSQMNPPRHLPDRTPKYPATTLLCIYSIASSCPCCVFSCAPPCQHTEKKRRELQVHVSSEGPRSPTCGNTKQGAAPTRGAFPPVSFHKTKFRGFRKNDYCAKRKKLINQRTLSQSYKPDCVCIVHIRQNMTSTKKEGKNDAPRRRLAVP